MRQLILYTITALLFTSCLRTERDKAQQQMIIERGVAIQVDEYKQRHERLCRKDAIEDAIAHVDSLVRDGLLLPRIDPVDKPPKPAKPEKPETKVLPDSLSMGLIRNQ